MHLSQPRIGGRECLAKRRVESVDRAVPFGHDVLRASFNAQLDGRLGHGCRSLRRHNIHSIMVAAEFWLVRTGHLHHQQVERSFRSLELIPFVLEDLHAVEDFSH